MTLELTIQDMFDRYPGLFKDRSDCLNHLFCTIGNGYEWRNGELCSDENCSSERKKDLNLHLVNGKAYQHNKLSLRAEAMYYAEMRKNKNENEYPDAIQKELDKADEKYFNSLPDNVYHKHPRVQRWSFYLAGYCVEFAKLFNYPPDIKQDWLAGIAECKRMLIEDGYDPEHPMQNPIDVKSNFAVYKNRIKERAYLEEMENETLD